MNLVKKKKRKEGRKRNKPKQVTGSLIKFLRHRRRKLKKTLEGERSPMLLDWWNEYVGNHSTTKCNLQIQ